MKPDSPHDTKLFPGLEGDMRDPESLISSPPIAIVGMACRFPGAPDLAAFWDLLDSGGNAITQAEPGSGFDRVDAMFPDDAVRSPACQFGAFVEDIDRFDAAFFRISPVEAQMLDPQQRMMLETSWHALEDAGIDPECLKGSRTGVYTGISTDEYRMMVLNSARPEEAAGCLYALSGTNMNGAAGRVSFLLGLMGPAKAVDAACASSLVSVHDAVADLQQGKADLAIAGGVHTMLNGRVYELRADSMMLSPDGQCKAFDASANGYVRGEGCGVVILKRLSEAQADGDRIWAVIRGAAVNHGGASSGLTVPNTPALEAVIEAALSHAGMTASMVDYLEAHGTGTTVGDPIEINAAAAAYGQGRSDDRPLLVGSVKTNIGHLEAAAGVAGLIKAALVVHRGMIPMHLHFHDPNPSLDWDHLPLRVITDNLPWPYATDEPRRAGVNSFGISGTNAHIILEQYRTSPALPEPAPQPVGQAREVATSLPQAVPECREQAFVKRTTRLLPLSAKSKPALHALAERYLSWLDQQQASQPDPATADEQLANLAWTASIGRSHFDYRAGLAFSDVASLQQQLREVAQADELAHARARSLKVAFAYTGQGSQWSGMGQALYEREPVVRAVLDRCESVFFEQRGALLLDVMFDRPGARGAMEDTAWEQPALYALECALTALWASLGVRPSIVLGHSVGELAAAQAAGVYSLEDGMRFAEARGRLLSRTAEGAMAAVFAPVQQVTSAIDRRNKETGSDALCISGYNGLHQVVSGPVQEVEGLLEHFASEGIRTRRLNTARAFHSALVEPVLDELEASLEGVVFESPSVEVISNLTGAVVEPGETLDAKYWRRHAREAVAFSEGTRTLSGLDVDLVVEIGPRKILAPMLASAWPDSAQTAPPGIASLQAPSASTPEPDSDAGFLQAVAKVYEAGLPVHFEALFAGESRARISLPHYPFQRERHWMETPRRHQREKGHPLLGVRHESADGGITYETRLYATDPAWLGDHRVFERIVVPGAVYGAMAALASLAEGALHATVRDVQLHNAMVVPDADPDEGMEEPGATLQLMLGEEEVGARSVRVFSKGDEGDWVLHAEGRIETGASVPGAERVDLQALTKNLSVMEVSDYYRARAETGIGLGPSFQTLNKIWAAPGEALAEVSVPEELAGAELGVHPLVLDGCFQAVGAARGLDGMQGSTTYLPFGWEQLWLAGPLPRKVFCHVRMNTVDSQSEAALAEAPEVQSGELRIYDADGMQIGGLSGYTVKRAERSAMLSALEGTDDLLYEVVWRECALASGLEAADFFPEPASVKDRTRLFSEYLKDAGVGPEDRAALLSELEHWSWAYALANLDRLGWQRVAGETVDPDALRQQLNVSADHSRLFRRMLEMLTRCGVLKEVDDGFLVLSGSEDAWPKGLVEDPEAHAETMAERFPHGLTEVGLFLRSGGALADVLRGQADPLTLLFSSGEPTAADLYLRAPVAQAANRMLGEAVRTLVGALPAGRRLRVIEVGAGTGSATASVLPELPQGQFEYTYTDISAGFFAEAEARFGDGGGHIDYRPLDIEKDPQDQGFEMHGYDLLIASNVLHATRLLPETLAHCLKLLAPSGQLIALENLRGQGWMDLTFGQLDGWWRFADDYRPHHALANPAVWRQALGDAGFDAIEILGVDESETTKLPDRGVIVARGPAHVHEAPGAWIMMADEGNTASHLAHELAVRNQTVVLAGYGFDKAGDLEMCGPGVYEVYVDAIRRESWQQLVERLPGDLPFSGVVHFAGLDGHGMQASTTEIAEDVERTGASALALVQGVADSAREPANGTWLITRGAQILERERGGELAGAILWGFGKAVDREAAHLCPRMIDLDPQPEASLPDLANELLYPDAENHIAYRLGRRQVARLVRFTDGPARLALPKTPDWVLAPDPGGTFDRPCVQSLAPRSLEPREVRVEVDAAGLNFWDVFRSLGFIEEGLLGREMCGRVIEAGSDVSSSLVGKRVIGLGFGAFGPQMVTREELVSPAPSGYSVTELASVPSAYVSAALSYELSGLQAGERVLIHAGAGGVGLAAIQLAQAAGAEVLATASIPKQAYLRSLGVTHLFDSRTTAFGEQILEVTGGAGVDVVLNSLTSEGFIDASLSCLRQGGRFVELARRDILSPEEMAAVRPDVGYDILELDVLKKTDPAWVGRVLDDVTKRLASGEIGPIVHSRWPLAEAGAALRFMRSARHLGKIVVTAPPLAGRLRQDGTYLVTGGLGGIGIAVADWLVGLGAGTLVLNGRRSPDAEAEEAIQALRERGASIHVELADVTDAAAMDQMLSHIDQEMPPLAGVIHSVGVLSDGALTNQNWERFEQVLGPKILGAWHLHRSTLDRNLDFFILFSSRVGVMGNPGQANHAAANAFLDQLAGHRRAMGLAGQAIAWGAWSEIGEAAEQKDRIERQRSALGGRWFTPQQGLKALERLVRQDVTTSVVMSMDWSVFEKAVDARPPFLEEMLVTDDAGEADAPASSADVMARLRQTPASERGPLLESYLQGEVQAVLRLPSAPEPAVGFFDLGMDSLMAVELRNRLNRAFSDEYTASNTVVFDYPDIISLARHLSEELDEVEGSPAPQVQPAPVSAPEDASVEGGIAIIGMACRFPGARDLSEFWQVLDEGRETVSDGREDTGLWDGVLGDPAVHDADYQRGGFIEGIDHFDARFFGIRPIEAHAMDPQQRMLLETSWQALEDAGIDPEHLRGSQTGVYAGIASSEYRDLMMNHGGPSYLGTAGSMAVGRVSFCLGLEGPAMPVMLNCASSLVAIHHAVVGLDQGEVDLALAGGVNAILSSGLTRELAELGMLSRDGRCKTFNASADGFVRSEGCGMIILKRLHEAQADGDRIWGVIRGSAINHSGASAGPTVPTGPTKERVIEEALAGACVSAHEVDYLEAHGGGSELGDSIEVNASARVYGRGREADNPLLIGSVKTNLGHLESAAGIAALIKTVLAMDRRRIPQHLHFHDPNPHTDWEQLPVRVVSEAMDWPLREGRPARAGVSAFGISGTNAHVVVEGYQAPGDTSYPDCTRSFPAGNAQQVTLPTSDLPRETPSEIPAPDLRKIRLLPLSGKSQGVLGELAEAYLAWLDEHSKELSGDDSASGPLLSDMAWTASTGRAHFDHRAGILFSDAASLRAQLQSLARGPGKEMPAAANADSHDGQTDEVHAFMLEVAEAYEAGRAVSLAGLFEGEMRRRISVPGYPFERQRFWVKA